jgi:two-component system, OmpR family, sensor histidine kinase MprB
VTQLIEHVRQVRSRLSLRARVALLAALGVGLAIALTAAGAYLTVRDALLDQVDRSLLARAEEAVTTPLTDPDRLVAIPAGAFGDLKIAILLADGTAVYAGNDPVPGLLGDDELAVARRQSAENVRTTTVDGTRYRVVAVPARGGLALVIAEPTAATDATLQRLGLVTLAIGFAGILIAAWVGSAVARTALTPVRRLTAAAEHVAETKELTPIPVVGTDELARLSQSFNAMLGALAEAQARQRQLVADAGHELRTPLTSLRTNLDLLAQSDAVGGLDPTERLALLADVRAQLEELSTLVTDLIELSRDDIPQLAREPLDLADVTRRAAERVRRRAPDVTISLDLRPWMLDGDAQLLERAMTNLLDNATKWSAPGGVVQVQLRNGELSVTDEGVGIAEEDLPHIFERFYRSSEARGEPGSGLGLAIVQQAAHRHGGTVTAENVAPPTGNRGARLTLRLPGTPGDTATDSWEPLGSLSGTSQPAKRK